MDELGYVSAAENDFYAEETLIQIVPFVDRPPFRFISGVFGPFIRGDEVSVPLWLAINLHNKGKCSIVIPDWFTVDRLEEVRARETEDEVFQQLPYHYIEISHALLNTAAETIPQAGRVKSLLKDIMTIRMDRIRIGLLDTAARAREGEGIKCIVLQNIAAMEVQKIRGFISESLSTFDSLGAPRSAPEMAEIAEATARGGGGGGSSGTNPIKRLKRN